MVHYSTNINISAFQKSIDNFLKAFLVDPIFSTCYPSNWVYDIATLTIAMIIAIPIIKKTKKGAYIPFKWYCIAITCMTAYLFYRIAGEPFDFMGFSFDNKIKLLDSIAFIQLIILCSVLLSKLKGKPLQVSQKIGFEVDEAIEIKENNDLLNRHKFIKKIAEKIRNTTSKNGSFPIGVVAAWGAGKTTFLNTLKSEFTDPNAFVLVDFNVWKCNDTSLIIETLFKLLREQLKADSFTIGKKLQHYATDLLKETNNEGLKSIANLTEVFSQNPNIEEQYDLINDELKRINKKIIILIDDIDRLDKKEIYEVIRLIRNTANFTNTFFIDAYDRNYILNSIEEINPYQSHLFLEKIFQVEFALPLIDNRILQTEITNRLWLFLSEKSKSGYKELTEQNFVLERVDI